MLRENTKMTTYKEELLTKNGTTYAWMKPCLRPCNPHEGIQEYILKIQEEFSLSFNEVVAFIENGIQRKHKRRYTNQLTTKDCKEIAREFKKYNKFWEQLQLNTLCEGKGELNRTCKCFYSLRKIYHP